MNTILWVLVMAGASSGTSPNPLGVFRTEAACESVALQLAARSKARRDQSGRWMFPVDGVCLPVDPATVVTIGGAK